MNTSNLDYKYSPDVLIAVEGVFSHHKTHTSFRTLSVQAKQKAYNSFGKKYFKTHIYCVKEAVLYTGLLHSTPKLKKCGTSHLSDLLANKEILGNCKLGFAKSNLLKLKTILKTLNL